MVRSVTVEQHPTLRLPVPGEDADAASAGTGWGRTWQVSPDLMGVTDERGVFTISNPAWGRTLGWSAAELAARPCFDFVHPDDVGRTRDVFAAAIERGEPAIRFENRYRRKDGGWRWLSWVAVPDGGRVYCSARDVTPQKELDEQLRQAQKLEAVGQLTGGVAHDFNNILTVIRSSIDVLRLPQLPEARRLRFMESIANAVTRATKLTSQLLAFARRQALQPAVFDAAANLEAIGDMVNSLTGAGITVESQAPHADCFVNVDPSQFDTAIVNLAVNARDAMAGHGKLTMRVAIVDGIPAGRSHAARTGEFIAVSVADTGSGISPEHITQIFEPFFTTKGVGEGTGLGLSQVFGFAKQSGGEIDVASTPGVGSTFTLYLPRAGRPASAQDDVTPAARIAEGGGARILVVEDNNDVAHSVVQTLEQLGYSTVHVLGADQALAELDSNQDGFALVFSDVVMAGRSGVELGHEIRHRHPSLPVILSSGYSHVLAADPTHGFQLLPKPYAIEELARVLHEAITRTALPGDAADLRPADLESMRLAELDSMGVLDTEAEAAYDELTRLAASLFDAPIALVSLIDSDRQWFKSRVGLQASETPREHAFCAHAIQDPEQVMVVADATRDPRFAGNPLVTGDPNIRFYAGAPLLSSSGHALGTLCVIDRQVRDADPKKLDTLRFLAAEVIQRMEARRAALKAATGQ